jgi:hypothetical protein
MANFSLTNLGTAVAQNNPGISLQQTTATPLVTPTFSSIANVFVASISRELGSLMTGINTGVSGFLMGRRPASGQLYPRGNYNR